MDERVVTDELWTRLESLLPVPVRRYRFPGRRRVDNRAALEGILFVPDRDRLEPAAHSPVRRVGGDVLAAAD
jgi:hypothetical protein